MDIPAPPATREWTVGVRLWVERAGQAILGKGRLELLEGIGRWHSISEAARQMKMSYRHAWLLVQSINEAAGEPLVVSSTGGTHGGGARLTALGQWTVTMFRGLQEDIPKLAAAHFPPSFSSDSEPAGIHVAASVSLEEVLGQLVADYALRRPAVRVRFVFGAANELADHIVAGAPADLFLAADQRSMRRLAQARLLKPRSQALLAENSLVALGAGKAASVVRRPRDLLRDPAARIALAERSCPLGGYTQAYLESRGLYERVLAQAVWVDSSRAVVSAVRAGRADVGLAYGSDAVGAPDCRVLFRARGLPRAIRYVGAVLERGGRAEEARSLLRFLTSPAAAGRFRRCGFQPAGGPGHKT